LRRKRLWLPELPGKDEDSKEGTPLDDGEGDISEEELLAKLREHDEPTLLFGESHRARLRRAHAASSDAETQRQAYSNDVGASRGSGGEGPRFCPGEGISGAYFPVETTYELFHNGAEGWELALARRETSVKESFQGKVAYTAMVQT
jgi:pre-mRNA-splicing factor 18